MSRFFTSTFWFSSALASMSSSKIIFLLIVFGGFIALAIFAKVMVHLKRSDKGLEIFSRRIYRKFYNFFLTFGLIGLALVFFNYERVPLLNIRFLYVLCGVGFVIWLVFILRYIFKEIPVQRAKIKQKQEFEKYLP